MAATEPTAQGALVDAIAAKLTEAHATNVGVTHDSLRVLLDSVLEGHEADLAAITAPILARHVNDLDLPAPVRNLFDTLQDPAHQTQFFTALFAVRAIIDQFVFAAIAPLVQDVTNKAWPALGASVPLTPAEAATGVLKGVMTQGSAAAQAVQSGVNGTNFGHLVEISGQAVGMAEALLLLRRGQITDAQFQAVLQYSNMNPKFYAMAHLLRYAPPPAGEVLAGAVQNHLTLPEAQKKLAEAGIDPVNFQWMYDTHGRPPSPLEVAHLVHRGLATRAQFDQSVAESDIKNKYAQMLFDASTYIPPVRSIVAMVRAGAISDVAATALFQQNGVRASDIAGYLAEAHHTKASAVKELSQAQTLRMFGAKFITRATATARLERLGFDAATIGLLLDFADEAQHERYTNAVVTRVHARYVSYKLTAAEVHNALNADKIPAAAIADLLALWNIERDANVHVLTPSQIVAAYRRKQIAAPETKRRLTSVGVLQADLAIVVADGYPPTKVDEAAVMAVVNA